MTPTVAPPPPREASDAPPCTGGPSPGAAWRARVRELFTGAYGTLEAWLELPLETRLSAPSWARSHAASIALSEGRPLPAAYVLRCRSAWGTHLAYLHPAFHQRFLRTATVLGFHGKETQRQWATLAKACAVAGRAPNTLTREAFHHARQALLHAAASDREGSAPISLSTPLHGLEATLTALGITPQPASLRHHRSRGDAWRDIEHAAPELARTMRAYLRQIALTFRPGTVSQADTSLRTFARFLTLQDPAITGMQGVTRAHIEAYKLWLPNHPGYRGKPHLSSSIVSTRLSQLRSCFDRIIEWGWPDAPHRTPLYDGDLPLADDPLPRFLDDAAARKLLTAVSDDPDPFARLAVTLLARTGMRKGELLALEIDAITRIGPHHWLRIPIGKLRTDRYVPLHPTPKAQLEAWLAQRPQQPSNLMFTSRGRPIPPSRVDKAVRDAATRAGIGHVTPHQLRHTLATQAINRGMSLEAIAALLGHKDLKMTLRYARIADHNVAKEYFHVTRKIEALYQPAPLPADAEGQQMRKLRTELTRRMLGNGYCTRPPELDCQYESLCERCALYQTDNDFRDVLTKQRDDAASKGQHDRRDLFHNILQALDDTTA